MHDVRTIFHLITVRNEVIFSQTSVSHSVQCGGGGVCLSACWDTHIPRQVHPLPLGRYTPQTGTPWAGAPLPSADTLPTGTPPAPRQAHPQAGKPRRQVHPRAGTPPAGTPPGTPPGQVHLPRQVHPPYPRAGTPPRRSLQWMVRILLECFLVSLKF